MNINCSHSKYFEYFFILKYFHFLLTIWKSLSNYPSEVYIFNAAAFKFLKWFNTIYRQHACLAIIECCRQELWECVILYLCAFGTCWSICKCSNCVQTPWWFIFSPVMWIIFWSLHFLSWAAIASASARRGECKNSHYIYW